MVTNSSYDYTSFIGECFKTLSENSNILQMTTSLDFLLLWCERQGRVINKEKISLFCKTIIPLIFPPLQIASTTAIHNKESHVFVSLAAQIVTDLRSVDDIFSIHEFIPIIQIFCNYLSIPISSPEISNAKVNIIDYFEKSAFMFTPISNFNPVKQPFIQAYQQQIGELLINHLLTGIIFINSINNNEGVIERDSNLLFRSLGLVNILMKRKVNINMFLNEDFITKILIPSSFLTNEDMETFVNLPEQYLEFCLVFSKDFVNSSVRTIISLIVAQFPSSLVETVFRILMGNFASPIEFEAKIFLMAQFCLYHKIPVDIFGAAAGQLKQGCPLHFAASLLVLLSCISDFDHSTECIEIATFFLINIPNPVVQVAAVDLLRQNIDEKTAFNALPLDQIIMSIMKLATIVQHVSIGKILEQLVNMYSDAFLPISIKFVVEILSIWNIQSQTISEGSDNTDNSSLLLCITQVIMQLPQNCQTLFEMSEILIPFILNALSNENNGCNGFYQLIDIFGCLVYKIDEPPQSCYSFLQFLASNLTNHDVMIYFSSFSVVICSLINKNNFFSLNLVDFIVSICDSILNNESLDYAVPSSLFILTCIIQCGGELFVPLAIRAANLLKMEYDKDRKNVNIAAMILFSTALIANENVAIQMVDHNLVMNWVNNFNDCYCVGSKKQYIHWTTIGLLKISKYSCFEAFIAAVKQFLFLKAGKNENCGIHNDSDDEFDDDGDYDDFDDDLDLKIDSLPYDNIVCDQEFLSIDENDPRIVNLPDNIKMFLIKYLH